MAISVATSQAVEELDHRLALLGVRKSSAAGADIIGEMGRIGGAGDDSGDRLMPEQEFQEELWPCRRIEFFRPFRHALAAHR